MKKILTVALCAATAASMCAQKAVVEQAKKLAGKIDKIEEARSLYNQAIQNPETANDVNTYVVAGNVEFKAYDAARQKQMINPNDKSVDPMLMATNILNGYNMYMRALPLDSLPNEKGEVKAKNSKHIISQLQGKFNEYFNAGGTFYNEKKFYPEAYEAFMAYGTFPSTPYATKNIQAVPDSVINQAFFYAGLSGYAGKKLPEAAKAFKAARENGYDNPQSYIYEIACWQNMALDDPALEDKAKVEIEKIAMAGYDKFGMSQPLFINNLVNSYVQEGRMAEATQVVQNQIDKTPDNPALYGLMGYVLDRQDDHEGSVAAYRKAISFDNADFETLRNAARKLYNEGTVKWDAIQGNNRAAQMEVKNNYFDVAKAAAERAKVLNPDSDIDSVLERIDYVLTQYFPAAK